MRRTGKIALFIDGAHLYVAGKALALTIDFKRLLNEFQGRGFVVRAFYYAAVSKPDDAASIRPLLDWLVCNGFAVVSKPVTECIGGRKAKCNIALQMTVQAMELTAHVGQMFFSPETAPCARW